MARPREFDEAAVLEAAIQCFWSRGYDGTSVRDLAKKMRITGASLYNAFGDKRSLYRRALDCYVEQSFVACARRFEEHLPPRDAIGAFFGEVIKQSLSDTHRKGCMVVNSALEVAPHDPEFRRLVAHVFVQVEAFFRRCVAAGQRSEAITRSQAADDLARLLLSVLLGIRVLARIRPERELLEGLVRPAFALLDNHKVGKQRKARRPHPLIGRRSTI
jgi:TetR/AcrR family transcriptional regulator, transcriptional repressor for nem operon